MTDYPDGTATRLYVLDTVELVKVVQLIQEITTIKTVDKITLLETLSEIATIDDIANIDLIKTMQTLETVDEILRLDEITLIGRIAEIKAMDAIQSITEVKKIAGFTETGTLTYISNVATGDIKTPTTGYRTRLLGGILYSPTDIQVYLRWKNSTNFVMGVPTVGVVGMNPFNIRHPLGALNEILELYMSAAGTVKGWIVTEEVYGTPTAQSQSVAEPFGLKDIVSYVHTPYGGPYFGYNTIGTDLHNISDPLSEFMCGTYFTCPANCTAQNIHVALKSSAPHNYDTKCAIYKLSDYSLVGQTEEKTLSLTTTAKWFIFNFTEPKPTLESGVDYILIAWVSNAGDIAYMLKINDDNEIGRQRELAYGDFPSYFGAAGNTYYKHSIFCVYSL